MDEQTFKKLLEDALDPIKKDLVIVKKDVNTIHKTLGSINETLDEHTRKLEAVSSDIHNLQEDVTALKDSTGMYHNRDKREIDEIKKHIGMPLIPDIPE